MSPTSHTPNSTLPTPFGARYYQSTHSFWLSVDPLADKYPNLSPYVYCTGNPVKLVDEDGREIEYNSLIDRIIVGLGYIFDKTFREKIKELKQSDESYVFFKDNNSIGSLKSERPFLGSDGKKIFINYFLTDKDKEGGETIFSVLKHETEHAVQFEHGEIGFVNRNGHWTALAYDLSDEYNANEAMYRGHSFKTGQNHRIWTNSTKQEKIRALHNAYEYLHYDGTRGELSPINIPFPKRRQDDKVFVRPYTPRK